MYPTLQLFKAAFFRALAHPIRIRILEVLGTGEHSVQQLQQELDLEQPIVSPQLAILRGKNVVTPRKMGTTVRYALSERPPPAMVLPVVLPLVLPVPLLRRSPRVDYFCSGELTQAQITI